MYKEPRIKKRYYTIGELAELLNVATSKLRYWENFYKIPVNRTQRPGRSKLERIYNRDSAIVFVRINKLSKTENYTLLGIGRQLELV